jgi:iron complex outermembrane receptor protein
MSAKMRVKNAENQFGLNVLKFCLLASAVMPATAFAQNLTSTTPGPNTAVTSNVQSPPGPVGLEEVIVTAERREEKLSKVPIDISSFKASDLQATGITTAVELPLLVPTLVQVRGPNADAYETPFIRGVGSSSTQPGDDASVATYIDGVYQADKTANLFNMNDIDHIEVLKGPQGTLFGRNATGGAINIITKRPSFTPTFSAEASYGSFDETVDRAYISGPITSTLAGSVSVLYRSGGNFIHDTTNNSNLGGTQGTSLTAKLLWLPNDNLEVTLAGILNNQISHFDSSNIAFVPGTVPVGGAFFGGKFSTQYNSYAGAFVSYVRQKNVQPQLHITYSFDDFDVTSTTAYVNANDATPLDYDGTSASVFYFLSPHQITRSWSQEFQAKSTGDGPFQWVGGLYYSDDTQGQQPVYLVSGAAPPSSAANFLSPSCTARGAASCNLAAINNAANDQAFAIFGEGSYVITPDDKITIGLRYSQERKQLQGVEDAEIPIPGPHDTAPLTQLFPPTSFAGVPLATADTRTTYRKPTWRFAYSHDFDENIHGYFSYNRGFKSGAYNLTSLTQPPVSPEVIDAYEIGLKSKWFDRRLELNPSLYYYDYSNLQVQKVAGGTVTVQNAGAAKLYGLDMDWVFLATDDLRFHGSLSLEHSEYSPYNNASSFGFAPGSNMGFGVATTVDATGHSLIYAPVYAFNIGVSYNYTLPGDSSLLFDSNFAYTGKYEQVAAAEGNYIFPHEDLSASLTWYSADKDYYVRIFGRNLTDLHVVGTQLNTVGYFLELQQPRMIAGAIGVNFGAPPADAPAPTPYVPPPVVAPQPSVPNSYLVFFDFNRSDLTPQAVSIVGQAAANAGPAKVTRLEVTGHTDTVGSDAYNMRLSRRRAESVAAELEKDGIPAGEIAIFAKGKRDLLVPTADGVKEPQNRRVQIVYSGGPTS